MSSEHRELVVGFGIASVLTLIGTLVLLPVLVVRMDENYFMPGWQHTRPVDKRRPVVRWTGLVLKNLVGLVLFAAGLGMLFLPGQGLLTLLMGLMLLDFPGKRALELRLIRLPGVLKTINLLRRRSGHPPLRLPDPVPKK